MTLIKAVESLVSIDMAATMETLADKTAKGDMMDGHYHEERTSICMSSTLGIDQASSAQSLTSTKIPSSISKIRRIGIEMA